MDAYGNETDLSYNIANQVTQVTMPATGQTGMGHAYLLYTYQYAGGPLASVKLYNESATLVRETDYTYGYEGELLSRSGGGEPVTLAYDAAYRTTEIGDGNSHTTHYYYNTARYLSEIRYPGYTSGNADRVQFTDYDDAGNLLQRIDGRGITTNYEYLDDGGNLSDIEYPASSGQDVSLTYDDYGRLESRTDAQGSYSWDYDDRDGVVSTSTTYTGLSAKTISRVRRRRCRRPLPSEPCVRVSPHTAQASRTPPWVFGRRGQARTGFARASSDSGWAARWSAAVSRPGASLRAG